MAQTLLPLMLVGLVAVSLPRRWFDRPALQYLVAVGLAVLVGRYLWWRFTQTVLPAQDLNVQCLFVWALFLIEMLVWLDATVMFMALLRRTDRSGEADRHEARLRAAEPGELPVVDVLIATLNEPLEVVEKTLVGARSLDWPSSRLRVHVLDDGRRDWLKALCAEKGVGYMTRPDNQHAKAGNLNAAIARTSGEFFVVLDADFVPQENFLFRAMGFFEDPKVGIVQIPHNFFNGDPMQTSLGMQRVLPDDQRLFFDAITPGRDGWNCAFCCGSNSITRRSAIMEIGGGLPTESITEDMLLTLRLLRKGYVTRYLNERLAIGLAPESLAAFFVQRARWARGAIQIMHLDEGPFGPGLKWYQRLMFLPTHWMTQSLGKIAAMVTPAIFLWTGLLPLLNANSDTVLSYQLPAIVATLLAVRMFAPRQFFPLAATAHNVLQAFRMLPVILATLVKPYGHAFKVTPKGRDAMTGITRDRTTIGLWLGLVAVTAVGLYVNAGFNSAIVPGSALIPIVAFWSIVNMVVLTVVATIAVSPPQLRGEERFDLDEPCNVRDRAGSAFGNVRDLSLSGARITIESGDDAAALEPGAWCLVEVAGVGRIPAVVRRLSRLKSGATDIGVQFYLPQSPLRDALIRRLFTHGLDNSTHTDDSVGITTSILLRVFRGDRTVPPRITEELKPPEWVLAIAGGPNWTPEWREKATLRPVAA